MHKALSPKPLKGPEVRTQGPRRCRAARQAADWVGSAPDGTLGSWAGGDLRPRARVLPGEVLSFQPFSFVMRRLVDFEEPQDIQDPARFRENHSSE